jgi:CheY-like chemotaxis protein
VTPEECRLRQDWIPGHFVEVAVQDTGHGMTPEVASRAVEPFFTTKDPGAGSGLGLAVVRNIAHSHGGHVALESAPGQGTTVMVRLPQSRSSDVGAPPDEDHIAGTASAHGEWILLVEDEQDSLIYAQKVLERAGYRIRPALHGTLAIDLLDQNRSDIALVILDVTLPGMPGREVLTQLRGRDPRVPVILCSSFADEGLDPRMIEEVQGVLKKPFRSRELLGQVAEVLASARAEH